MRTFVVAMLQALTGLRGLKADHQKIAEMAIEKSRRMVESGQYKTRAAHVRDQILHYRSRERFQAFVDGYVLSH